MSDQEKRLTLEEVAEFLGVSVSTIKRLVNSKALIAVQVGVSPEARVPRYRFRLKDVLAFEESRLTRPEAVPDRVRRQKPPQIVKRNK